MKWSHVFPGTGAPARGKARGSVPWTGWHIALAVQILLVCATAWLAVPLALGAAQGDRPCAPPHSAAGRPTSPSGDWTGDVPEPPGTPTPESPSSGSPEPAAAPTDWSLLMYDSFDDNANSWAIGSVSDDKGTVSAAILDGMYAWEMETQGEGLLNGSGPDLDPLADFYAALDVRRAGGSDADVQYGLTFRFRDSANYYLFDVSEAAGFKVWRMTEGYVQDAVDRTATETIRPGEWNRLAVRAVGPDIAFYINDRQVAQLSDDAVAEGELRFTIQATGPAIVHVDNFEVRPAPVDASLTPFPTAIPTPTPYGRSAICPPPSAPAPADWPLVMCDSFDDNANAWGTDLEGYDQGKVEKAIVASGYVWEMDTGHGLFTSGDSNLGPLADFYLAVDARRDGGSGAQTEYGLIFRCRENAECYQFMLSDRGAFRLSHLAHGSQRGIIDWVPAEAIRPNEWNRLAVRAVGPSLTLYINDQHVAQVTDDASLEGDILPAAFLLTEGDAIIQFDNFEVRAAPTDAGLTPVPTPPPTPTLSAIDPASCPPSPPSAPGDWPIVLCDTFDDNRNDWKVGEQVSAGGDVSRTINGTYACEFKVPGPSYWHENPLHRPVADFYVSVEARRRSALESTGYGLMFRKVDNDNFLLVVIDDLQRLRVMARIRHEWRELMEPVYTPAIRPGQTNRIAVKGQKWTFTIYVNDEVVAELADVRFNAGLVGIIVAPGGEDEGVVEFDNFELREAAQR